jgi:hypothetical protein
MTASKRHPVALTAAAGLTALVTAMVALLVGGTTGAAAAPPDKTAACPDGGEIRDGKVPSAKRIWRAQLRMIENGPRIVANPALAEWQDYLSHRFRKLGLDVDREGVQVNDGWWDHREWSLKLVDDGEVTDVPVSAYRPYSGFTGPGGMEGQLADAGLGTQAEFDAGEFDGKVALITQPAVPRTRGDFLTPDTLVYDPDGELAPSDPYNRAWTAIQAPQNAAPGRARTAGAVAAIVAWDYSAEGATGQWIPFSQQPSSAASVVPTLYVDRETGAMLRERVADGASVRVALDGVVHPESGELTDDIVATLPGMSDEVVIVNSHSDGISASQENGAVGMLALAKYFSSLPKSCRSKTLVFALPVGHFRGGLGGDTARFVQRNPEIIERAVGSLTLEHLGQMEWVDDELGFHPTGRREGAIHYTSPSLVDIDWNAILAEDWRFMQVTPTNGPHFGIGSALKSAGVPNIAFIAGPHHMFSWGERIGDTYTQNIEQTSKAELHLDVRAFARMVSAMDDL